MRKEVNEVQEVEEAKEKNGDVAAFFDLDGTLMPTASLEKRYFAVLRYRKRLIGIKNYFSWLIEKRRASLRGGSIKFCTKTRCIYGAFLFMRKWWALSPRVSAWKMVEEGKVQGNGGKKRERRRQARVPVPLLMRRRLSAWRGIRNEGI